VWTVDDVARLIEFKKNLIHLFIYFYFLMPTSTKPQAGKLG